MSFSHMRTYILHVIICIVHTDTLIQDSSIDPYVDNSASFRGASDDVFDNFDVSMGFYFTSKNGALLYKQPYIYKQAPNFLNRFDRNLFLFLLFYRYLHVC